VTGLAPARHIFFNEAGLGIMLREEFGLVVNLLGRMGFKRLGDPRVQLLAGIAQQAAVSRILHQHVLKGVDRVRGRAALKYQLGGDKATQRRLQLVLGKTGDGRQQRKRKFASDRRANLRHPPHWRQPVKPRQ